MKVRPATVRARIDMAVFLCCRAPHRLPMPRTLVAPSRLFCDRRHRTTDLIAWLHEGDDTPPELRVARHCGCLQECDRTRAAVAAYLANHNATSKPFVDQVSRRHPPQGGMRQGHIDSWRDT